MRTLSISIAALLLLFIVACRGEKPSTTEVAVLQDVTDTQLASQDATEILGLYQFSEDKWNGGVFRFSTVSDVSMNKIQGVQINAAYRLLSNELERGKEVKKFQKEVLEIIQGANSGSSGKNNSSVYLALAKTLNALSESKAGRRILLVYSDLMENVQEVSFYNKSELEILKSHPDYFEEKLEGWLPLQPIAGIEVHLLFVPADVISDKNFRTISEFYRKLLESKGAKVFIEANIQSL